MMLQFHLLPVQLCYSTTSVLDTLQKPEDVIGIAKAVYKYIPKVIICVN